MAKSGKYKTALDQIDLCGDELKLAIKLTEDLPLDVAVPLREWLGRARWMTLIKAHQFLTDFMLDHPDLEG